MLVTDTINSKKAWDDIKDLLRLKLCNANIHTYTSHFMDIQQWEKGLRNAHSIAARVYEKDPQALKDTITEVEKLSAAQ